MKFVLLVEESHKEYDYVQREPTRKRGPYVEDAYGDSDAENEDAWDWWNCNQSYLWLVFWGRLARATMETAKALLW